MAEEMRQFKVYLPADLIREIKYLAVDSEQSLSSIAATALRQHLRDARRETERHQGDSMASHGVEGLIIQTRNWGKTVAFWQALGYRVEFETGRNSGRSSTPTAARTCSWWSVPTARTRRSSPWWGRMTRTASSRPGRAPSSTRSPAGPGGWRRCCCATPTAGTSASRSPAGRA